MYMCTMYVYVYVYYACIYVYMCTMHVYMYIGRPTCIISVT